jgi:multiple sugar transport system permease protein
MTKAATIDRIEEKGAQVAAALVTPGAQTRAAEDHSEGMSYLDTLPRRVVTVYIPLVLIMIVLLFPFYWMVITSIKPDEQLLDLERFNRSSSSRRRSSTSTSSCSTPPTRAGSGTRC